MRLLGYFLLSSLFFATSCGAEDAQSVAPPELQKTIFNVLNSKATCKGPLVRPKVISNDIQPGAVIEDRKLVSGEVREIWQGTPCGNRSPVRFLFRLKPGNDGKLYVFGFEPMR